MKAYTLLTYLFWGYILLAIVKDSIRKVFKKGKENDQIK